MTSNRDEEIANLRAELKKATEIITSAHAQAAKQAAIKAMTNGTEAKLEGWAARARDFLQKQMDKLND